MDPYHLNDRKQYLEEIRRRFREKSAGEADDHSYYENEPAEEKIPRGYLKQRLVVSVILFLAFVCIWKNDWSLEGVNAAVIQEQIRTNISLPDSFSTFRDLF